ncbi:Dolichyl-phosphate beta-glucosyltransferase, partial [Lachnellula suecica]
MADILEIPLRLLGNVIEYARETPVPVLLAILAATAVSTFLFIYALVFLLAPTPRAPYASEKSYITTTPSGAVTSPKPLPCWHDEWRDDAASHKAGEKHTGTIDAAEVEVSVVIPAYNEEARILTMLEEAVTFLDAEYGRAPGKGKSNGSAAKSDGRGIGGYEILIVNDGSKDKTVDICLDFARRNALHDVLRVCTLKENRGKGGAVTHGFRH